MFDHVMAILEILLLIVIVWQGYLLLRNDREKLELDREQHKMAKERFEERAKWRDQKRQQALKKSEPLQSDAKNMGSLPPSTTSLERPKDGAVESAADIKMSLP